MSADTMQQNIALECQHVSQWFGDPANPHNVLHEINCQLVRGQAVACVGPSGCGKTTLLKAILGTQLAKNGKVIIHPPPDSPHNGDPAEVTRPGLDRGIVFQENSLFPYMTTVKNVAYGLMLRDLSLPDQFFRWQKWFRVRRQQLEQARDLLADFGLEKAASKYPYQLSGGMKRRVAIAQAMIMRPDILLLDEPFTGLDERSIEVLIQLLLKINVTVKEAGGPFSGTSIVLVTHELNSGIAVADRVVGISQYWDWEQVFETFPGATIVYDRSAPVYAPDMKIDYHDFAQQREEIFRAVYDPDILQTADYFRTFWQEVRDKHGTKKALR